MYWAVARRARQATSHGQNCHLAREDGLIQGFHERRLRGLAVPRLGVASRGFRPKETDLNTPPKHKESLPLSVAARGSSVAQVFVHYFDAVSLGQQIP